MIASTTCPDRERLQSVLDGVLDDPDLTAHLDVCPDCQRALEDLARGDTPLPPPRLAPEPTAEETALHRVIDELKDSPADGPTDEDFAVDFLTPSERPGSIGKFGKYEVEQVVGRGGMGVVLKAFDPDLNRIVAIKVIAPQFAASGSMRRRFTREARAAGAVCHDHVVTIHDVDTSGTLPYLVMQYVPGPSLQERLDRAGPLEVKEILRIGMQTAAGLAAAHAHGLIHRDVKPANILLEDDMERVKLTDFGLARLMDDVRITQSAVLAGTPQYMAPEQARGESLDPRADLFSLGCVLYAACVGRPPFRAGAPLVVMKRVCEETPRSIREQNPNIPEWLEAIVVKLLEKDPAARFQSGAEVSDLLGRCLAHVQQPKRVPLPPIPRRQEALPRRSSWRRRLAMAATFLALLVCGLGATVITVRTDKGTLVIEVDDPGVKVTVEGDHVLIIDPEGTEIRLRPGDYKVKATKDGKLVGDKPITIKRGEKTIVTVRAEKPATAEQPAAVGGVQVWDPRTGKAVLWESSTKPVTQTAFSADGKLIATSTADGTVHILDAATGKALTKFKAHRVRIKLFKFFPDRKLLVTVGDDGEVKLWDTATGKELSSLDLPFKPALAAISADGKVLAGMPAGGIPGKVWDVTTGKELATLEHSSEAWALALSPDGKMLAAGNAPGVVRLWDVSTGKLFRRFESPDAKKAGGAAFWPGAPGDLAWNTGSDESVAFAPDGKVLACGTGESVVRLWDVATGKHVGDVAASKGNLAIVAFSPDGRRLVSASDDGTVRLWDVTSGKEVVQLRDHEARTHSVTFSPDGKRLVTTTSDGAVKFWDAATGKETAPKIEPKAGPQGRLEIDKPLDRDKAILLEDEVGQARAAKALADANLQAAQAAQQRLEMDRYRERLRQARVLWEQRRAEEATERLDQIEPNMRGWEWHYLRRLAAGEKPKLEATTSTPLRELAFSPDGRRLAIAGADGTVHLVYVSSPGKGTEIAAHADDVQGVAFSPDGKLLATASTDGTARVWEYATGKPITPPLKHKGAVHAIAFSPDGRQFATGDALGAVAVWDPATGKQTAGHQEVGPIFGLAYGPDGKRLASAGRDGQVFIWEAGNARRLLPAPGRDGAIVAIAFMPGSNLLATGGLDGIARLWNFQSGKEVLALKGHDAQITAIAFSPDGKRLATASADKTVRLWDTTTGNELLTLENHHAKVTGVAFSPDGNMLATCGEGKRIIIYDGSPKEADESGVLVSVAVPLKQLKARDMIGVIKKMTGPLGNVTVDDLTNSLIVQDTAGNVKRIREAIQSAEKAELDKRH
jgi:WD40 repeat protein/serine/threonine protein kinase